MNYSKNPEKQYHISVGKADIGKYVILPGDPKRCEKIAKYFDSPCLVADNREYITYTGFLDGEKVSVTSTGIGGPSAAIALEELVNCGAHTFIRVGTCGGIELSVKGGELVVATSAVRAEGTSKEYAPVEYPAVADIEVINALISSAKKQGKVYHTGVVQSKDSFYGEHLAQDMPVGYELENRWSSYIKMGCLASEMESAALFITALYRRVRMGTVLLVMANQEREAKGLENPVFHDTDAAIKTAVEALRILISKDKEKNNE